MFSVKEKLHIAKVIEKTILDLKHPEMPTEKPNFEIYIEGKEKWSWANIRPNWTYTEKNPPSVNPFNEQSRGIHKELNK